MFATCELSQDEREFCIREYDRIGSELIENESMGEGRVALYLGVWSAAVAGVGALISSPAPAHQTLTYVALVGLAVVLMLGVVTAERIVKRNFHTDELIDSLARLRQLLRPRDAQLITAALPWRDSETLTKKRRSAVLHTGLLQVVYLANAVVPALGILAFTQRDSDPMLIAATVMAALMVQLGYAFVVNHRAWSKRLQRNKCFERFLRERQEQ